MADGANVASIEKSMVRFRLTQLWIPHKSLPLGVHCTQWLQVHPNTVSRYGLRLSVGKLVRGLSSFMDLFADKLLFYHLSRLINVKLQHLFM